MASRDKAALRMVADLARQLAAGDLSPRDVQPLLNRAAIRRWNGDFSKLFRTPEQQVQAWKQFAAHFCAGSPAVQLRADLRDIRPAPTLTEADRRDGYHGVCLCYGWPDHGGAVVDYAQSAAYGWQEVVARHPHEIARSLVFKEGVLVPRKGAISRPTGWFWRKVNLMPKNQTTNLKEADADLGSDEMLMGFEWFQMIGITHPHLLDYMAHFFEEIEGEWTTLDLASLHAARALRRADGQDDGDIATALVNFQPVPRFPSQIIGDLTRAPVHPARRDDEEDSTFSWPVPRFLVDWSGIAHLWLRDRACLTARYQYPCVFGLLREG